MKERLTTILRHYQLTSSRLADLIGVQRSGISHILSGRNNPGYDFIVRLLEKFPEINANWLLMGKGSMLKDEFNSIDEQEPPGPDKIYDSKGIIDFPQTKENPVPSDPKTGQDKEVYKSKQSDLSGSDISRIVILLKDGSFRDYHPA